MGQILVIFTDVTHIDNRFTDSKYARQLISNVSTFDYLTTPDFGFDSTNAWTLAFDVRDPGGAGGPSTAAAIISSQSPGAPDSWQLDNKLNTVSAVTETSGIAFDSLSNGAWHTIRLVHEANADTVSVYFNGTDVTASAGWATGRVSLENLTFASRNLLYQASVDIDNVMVWDTALSTAFTPKANS